MLSLRAYKFSKWFALSLDSIYPFVWLFFYLFIACVCECIYPFSTLLEHARTHTHTLARIRTFLQSYNHLHPNIVRFNPECYMLSFDTSFLVMCHWYDYNGSRNALPYNLMCAFIVLHIVCVHIKWRIITTGWDTIF